MKPTMTSDIDKRVGMNVRAIRETMGLQERDCAAALRMDVAQYLACESGTRRLQASELFALAERLRVPLSRFYRIDAPSADACLASPAGKGARTVPRKRNA